MLSDVIRKANYFLYVSFLVLLVNCTNTSTIEITASSAINMEVKNGDTILAHVPGEQNRLITNITGCRGCYSRTWKYRFDVDWPDSLSEKWRRGSAVIYLDSFPEIGDSLQTERNYSNDSECRDIGVYGYSQTSDTVLANKIHLTLREIPFNDSLSILDPTTSATPVNKSDIKEKHAFQFDIRWPTRQVRGELHWVKFDKITTVDYTNPHSPFENIM
jgi:hypothetical protein